MIDGICLPKTHSAYEMDALKTKLADFFSKQFAENVDIYPLIESAQGVVGLQEIFNDNQGQIRAIIVSSIIVIGSVGCGCVEGLVFLQTYLF